MVSSEKEILIREGILDGLGEGWVVHGEVEVGDAGVVTGVVAVTRF